MQWNQWEREGGYHYLSLDERNEINQEHKKLKKKTKERNRFVRYGSAPKNSQFRRERMKEHSGFLSRVSYVRI